MPGIELGGRIPGMGRKGCRYPPRHCIHRKNANEILRIPCSIINILIDSALVDGGFYFQNVGNFELHDFQAFEMSELSLSTFIFVLSSLNLLFESSPF